MISPRIRTVVLGAATLMLVVSVLAFPRVLAFVELGARELRYFWWIILLAGLAAWLAFSSRRPRE